MREVWRSEEATAAAVTAAIVLNCNLQVLQVCLLPLHLANKSPALVQQSTSSPHTESPSGVCQNRRPRV